MKTESMFIAGLAIALLFILFYIGFLAWMLVVLVRDYLHRKDNDNG
jgi:hypothetical protein